MEIIEKEIGHVIEIEESVRTTKMPSVMKKNFSAIKACLYNNNMECLSDISKTT